MVLATVGSTPTLLTLNEHLLQVISENKKEKESDTKKLDLYYLIIQV